MSKQKSHGKDKKKGSQLVIRVEKAERDAFVSLCDRLDTSAAREIRRFMRERVAAHAGAPAPAEVTPAADEAPRTVDGAAPVGPAETPEVAEPAKAATAPKAAKAPKKPKPAAQPV